MVTATELERVDAGIVAERYHVRRSTVLRWARLGWIPSERHPGCNAILFDLEAVEQAVLLRFRRGVSRGN